MEGKQNMTDVEVVVAKLEARFDALDERLDRIQTHMVGNDLLNETVHRLEQRIEIGGVKPVCEARYIRETEALERLLNRMVETEKKVENLYGKLTLVGTGAAVLTSAIFNIIIRHAF